MPRKDAHWLRQSSVFTLTRGLVGNTALRAYSGVLTDPALPDGAERRVLVGDAAAEIPRLLGSIRELVANLGAITASDAPLAQTLANTQAITGKLGGPGGALGVLLGNPKDAEKVTATLDRARRVLTRIDALGGRTDTRLRQPHAQCIGPQRLGQDAQATLHRLQLLPGERGKAQTCAKCAAAFLVPK